MRLTLYSPISRFGPQQRGPNRLSCPWPLCEGDDCPSEPYGNDTGIIQIPYHYRVLDRADWERRLLTLSQKTDGLYLETIDRISSTSNGPLNIGKDVQSLSELKSKYFQKPEVCIPCLNTQSSTLDIVKCPSELVAIESIDYWNRMMLAYA
jgi:hypothetical protein